MDIVVGLLEFVEENFEFVRIVGRRHLAEIVGGGQGAADDAFEGFAEAQAADILGGACAVDRAQHGIDLVVVGAEGGQVGCRERATPQHMAERVFGAGAGGVGAQFKVAGVVQEHGGEREFELPRRESRFDRG